MSNSRTRFYWLDLFRFLASLIVLLGHVRRFAFVEFGALPVDQKSLSVAVVYAMTRLGHEAVIIFFILSGFLVGGKAIERIAAGSFRPLDYAIDRITRIMLPLVPSLILTAVIGSIIGSGFNLWHFVGNLFFLQGIFLPWSGVNEPLWSLAYEAWFYVLVWAVGVAVLNRQLHLFSSALLIVVCAVFTKLSPVFLFCWLIGVFAYIRRPKKTSLRYLIFSIIVCLFAITAVQVNHDSVSLSVERYRYLVPTFDISRILLSFGIAIFIRQVILITPTKSHAIKLDVAGTRFAPFSYTLYLTHFPILQLISYLGIDRSPRINLLSIALYFFMVAICIGFAWVFYWLFERRTTELRRWIMDRLPGGGGP